MKILSQVEREYISTNLGVDKNVINRKKKMIVFMPTKFLLVFQDRKNNRKDWNHTILEHEGSHHPLLH